MVRRPTSFQLPADRRSRRSSTRRSHLAGRTLGSTWTCKSAYELLDSIGKSDGIRACSLSARIRSCRRQRRSEIERRLKSLDFLAVVDFFASETAQLADVVLPSAQWAKKMARQRTPRVVSRCVVEHSSHRTTSERISTSCVRSRLVSTSARASRMAAAGRTCSTSCGGHQRRTGRLLGHELRADRGRRRPFWPCPVPRFRHTSALRRSTSTSSGRARFHYVYYAAAGRGTGR